MRSKSGIAFEKWIKDKMPAASLHCDPHYWNHFVQIAWEAWLESSRQESLKAVTSEEMKATVNGVYTGSKQTAPFGHWSKRK